VDLDRFSRLSLRRPTRPSSRPLCVSGLGRFG
jgi:hypothetical protein